MKKGEIAFSTIVLVIIAAVVLIIVLVWMLPQFSDLFGKTSDISEGAGVNDEEIAKITCQKYCNDAQGLSAEDILTSDFCTDELVCKDRISCEEVSCG